MLSSQNLLAAFDRVTDYWSPKVIGRVNDQLLKVAKLKGEFVWHAHDGEDELFHVVKGRLRIEFEDGVVELEQGDFLTVPKGVRHNPVAEEECWVLLIEPASTLHTGAEVTDRRAAWKISSADRRTGSATPVPDEYSRYLPRYWKLLISVLMTQKTTLRCSFRRPRTSRSFTRTRFGRAPIETWLILARSGLGGATATLSRTSIGISHPALYRDRTRAGGSMAAIESKDETVSGVFKDFYVVPNYQREYVWSEAEVDQLLKDIRTEQAEGADAEYFIGSIVVCPRPDGAFDLIDGQQRTTTLFVILCAIRDHLTAIGDAGTESIKKLIADTITDLSGNDSFRARLDPQYEDAGDVFEKLVAGSAPAATGTRSMKNVATAYKTARDFLSEEFGTDPQAAKAFYGYLVHRVKLIRIRTDSIARALKIFETINDRGIGLDAMDLLKNLLFMQTDPAKFDRLKDRWKALTDALYKAGEKPLRFLRYYVFATYGVTKLREDELYNWFVKNEKLVRFSSDPIAFVERLQDALSAYLNFLKGVGRDSKESPAVQSISLLAGGSTRQHLILLLPGRDLPPAVFDALCADVEALLFTYLVTRQTNREFEVMFPDWAPGLAALRTIDEYEPFAEETLRKRRRELAARFHREFAVLDGSTLRQYQLRYILGKLTQHVDRAAYGQSSQSSMWLSRHCDGANVHIEHILPQSPDDEVRAEFGEGADSPTLLWSIGNLALAEKSINTSLGRRPFSYKRAIYPKSQYLLTRVLGEKPDIGQTAIDRAVAGMKPFETWSRADIAQRAEWLSNLAAETWSVPAAEDVMAETVVPA